LVRGLFLSSDIRPYIHSLEDLWVLFWVHFGAPKWSQNEKKKNKHKTYFLVVFMLFFKYF
jgi:hypothetical protein